jgi:hypothetical protein
MLSRNSPGQIFPEIGAGNHVGRLQQVARNRQGAMHTMEKLVFYGRTEAEIEDRFMEWQQVNVAAVRDIKRRPIVPIPATTKPLLLQHQKIESLDAFSMLVEYERD